MRLIDADALKAYIDMQEGRPFIGCTIGEAFKIMTDEQPTIQPEPHWIPVEQDTPTEEGDYWATFEAETGRFVDWASWYQGRWVVWIDGSPAPLSNVIAWQKSPEPYRG